MLRRVRAVRVGRGVYMLTPGIVTLAAAEKARREAEASTHQPRSGGVPEPRHATRYHPNAEKKSGLEGQVVDLKEKKGEKAGE